MNTYTVKLQKRIWFVIDSYCAKRNVTNCNIYFIWNIPLIVKKLESIYPKEVISIYASNRALLNDIVVRNINMALMAEISRQYHNR